MPRVLIEKAPSPMKLEVLGAEDWPLTRDSVGSHERHHEETETSYIVSGTGDVRVDDETPLGFTAGDLVIVMPGTRCTWHITEAIERHYNKG